MAKTPIKLKANCLKAWLKVNVTPLVVKDANIYNPKVPYFNKIS